MAIAIFATARACAFAQDGGEPVADPNVPPAVQGDELQQTEARRREVFRQMLAEPNNLDIAFEYAGLSARVGDVEGAIATLERMLIFAPGLPRLQLELGVLYFRLGADETARYYFEQAVSAPEVPEVVKARVDPYLAAIDKRNKDYTFTGTIVAGIRFQSNANAGPSSGTIFIPGFPDPLSLDSSALPQFDYNGYITSNWTYSYDLKNQGDRFNVNLVTYASGYAALDQLNAVVAELKPGPVFDLERFNLKNTRLGVNGIFGGILLAEDPYLVTLGAGSNLQTRLTPRTFLGLQAEYRHEEYYNSTLRPNATDRTGHRVKGSARVQQQLADRFSIFASIQGERRLTTRDYLDVWEWGGSAGWVLNIASPNTAQKEPWTVSMSGGYLQRDFDAPDPTIDPTQSELDEELFVQGTFTLPMRSGWALQAQGGYREVSSNYTLRIYENTHGSLGLMKRF